MVPPSLAEAGEVVRHARPCGIYDPAAPGENKGRVSLGHLFPPPAVYSVGGVAQEVPATKRRGNLALLDVSRAGSKLGLAVLG